MLLCGIIRVQDKSQVLYRLESADPVKEEPVVRVVVVLFRAVGKVKGQGKLFNRRYVQIEPDSLPRVVVIEIIPAVDEVNVCRDRV